MWGLGRSLWGLPPACFLDLTALTGGLLAGVPIPGPGQRFGAGGAGEMLGVPGTGSPMSMCNGRRAPLTVPGAQSRCDLSVTVWS